MSNTVIELPLVNEQIKGMGYVVVKKPTLGTPTTARAPFFAKLP